MAEDAWNTRDPVRVALAYTDASEWRNRTEFLRGRTEILAFLTRKWQVELDYRLKRELWAFTNNRIAVRVEYERHDAHGQWYRSYESEMWEFEADGLMARRFASINDAPIDIADRRLVPPERPQAAGDVTP
jgi:nuclear transport factor 2 (NTF2) superfamily protein